MRPRIPMPVAGCRALAVMLLPFLIAGCSQRADVLATVGSQTLTVDDFLQAARGAQMQYMGHPDSAKAMLYEDLMRRELLLEHAQRNHLMIDSVVASYRKNLEDQVLRSSLFERQVPSAVPVSEGELRQLYAWRDSVTRLQLIYSMERNVADAAVAAIKNGEDFAAVADRTNLSGMVPPGGMLDFLPPGSLVSPLDDLLRTGRVHQLIGPLQSPGEGWFVVRVVERKASPQEPFEQQAMNLQQLLQQRKRRLLSLRAYRGLKELYHVAVDPQGAHFMFEHYNRLPNGQPIGDEGPADPGPADLAQVLARYEDGKGHALTYTFRDALEDLQGDSGDRPNPALLPSFNQWIESRAVQRVAVFEARHQCLDLEPAIANTIRERVNNYIVNGAYETEVVQKAVATDADVQAAYQRHGRQLMRLQSATLQLITLPDSGSALRMIELAARARTLEEAILHSSENLRPREEVIPFPSKNPMWSGLEPRLLGMNPGSFGMPVRTPQGWMVYQLISKQQSMTPYESLPPDAQRSLQAEATEAARERRLIEITRELRQSLPVTEHRERLKSIRWPASSSGSFVG